MSFNDLYISYTWLLLQEIWTCEQISSPLLSLFPIVKGMLHGYNI